MHIQFLNEVRCSEPTAARSTTTTAIVKSRPLNVILSTRNAKERLSLSIPLLESSLGRLVNELEILCELESHAVLCLRHLHDVVQQRHSRLVGPGFNQLRQRAQTETHSVTGVASLRKYRHKWS